MSVRERPHLGVAAPAVCLDATAASSLMLLAAYLFGHGSMINGNALRDGLAMSSFRIVKTSEAVCVQNAVSEWPMETRRRFRGRYHGA